MQEGKVSPVFWWVMGVVGGMTALILAVQLPQKDTLKFAQYIAGGAISSAVIAYSRRQEPQSQKDLPLEKEGYESKIRTHYKNGKRELKPRPSASRYVSNSVPEVYLSQVARCTHNREAAERLLLQAKYANDGKDWEWCVNKILWDIERGR